MNAFLFPPLRYRVFRRKMPRPKGRRVESPEDVLPIASWTCRTRLYTQLPAGSESLRPDLVPFPGPSPSLWIPPKSWLLGFKSILESREICRSALRVSRGVQNFPLHLEKLRNPSTSFKKKHVLGIFSLKNVIPQTSPHTQTQKTSMYLTCVKATLAAILRSTYPPPGLTNY